jgi:UDP-N-acetylmuramyl pentapeptide synthase
MRAVAREKLSLLRAVPPGGVRVIDGDDPVLAGEAADLEVLRFGLGEGNDLRAVDLRADDTGTDFTLEGGPSARVPMPGAHHVRNALAALALARAHDVPLERGVERLRSFAGVPGRMSAFEAGGVLVVDDAYNANPASMRAALEWFGALRRSGRRALVLGDMLELGPGSAEFHREIGGRTLDVEADLVVFVGEEMRAGFEEASRRSPTDFGLRHVADSSEAARLLADWVAEGDAVLVKGSRGIRMERVVQALRERGGGHAV